MDFVWCGGEFCVDGSGFSVGGGVFCMGGGRFSVSGDGNGAVVVVFLPFLDLDFVWVVLGCACP